ncbi:MAG: 4-alpha-glucanotransferase [Paludibacter sp.]
MKIHFKIPYYTYWGQRMMVSGNIPELGNDDLSKAMFLNFQSPDDWYAEVEINRTEVIRFNYKYVLFNDQTGQYTEEWGDDRQLVVDPAKTEHFFCFDLWNSPGSVDNVFLSSPFQEVLLRCDNPATVSEGMAKFTHVFKVKMPLLREEDVICLVGDCDALGNWSTNNPLLLSKAESNWWKAEVDLSKVQGDVHYKYGVLDKKSKQFRYFESGPDHTVPVIHSKKTLVQKSDGFVRVPDNSWKGAGVGLPVFSIRTKKSFGVGDFVDLKLLVDWARKVGLKLIQVLPLNDTIGTHTEADVLPYAAISAFALNPLFLNLPSMGKLPAAHPLQKEYKAKQAELNASDLVPFLEVINYKLQYTRELYLQQKDEFLENANFKKFFEDNEYWLSPYAAYCVLRDRFGTPDYRQWKEYSQYDAVKITEFVSPMQPHFDEIAVNYFIQYHLHAQLSEAAAYAHANGVVLKGDIPIGVNLNSVDTWVSPELFHMHMQAGAPPDMFSVKGQNWELPTYNWAVMEKTNFNWWKKRFGQMSNYFNTFRIDHILGFFRIWQIPGNQVEGIMGHLNPSIPIHINEFAEKGLWFDYNRFCKPYITDSILWDFFGEDASWVKANCLQIEDGWVLRLKASYQSQVFVQNLFDQGKISERVKWGLFDLISNVLFFEKEGSNGTQFYPRFGMESLRTYRDLDNYTKDRLRELYVDYFYRRQDENWYQSGMEKLPALKHATSMLICGEDLGMMTPCVTAVMKELGILSLEVQRAPKSNKREFFHPSKAPYLSVVTPSTHDMSTIRGWWEEDRGVTQRFYNSQLGHWGEAPYFCDWWICRDIILQHLYSPAMWTVFQMQDLLSISEEIRRPNPNEERINVPSNSKFSWRYRLHMNMEDLLEKEEFNTELKNFITQSGR